MNENSGEIVAVKPESNGSFIVKIMAMLGDEIKILSMDQAGNQTLITYITFKSDDGKYLVTSKGGIVTGEGGLKLDIPEGALLGAYFDAYEQGQVISPHVRVAGLKVFTDFDNAKIFRKKKY